MQANGKTNLLTHQYILNDSLHHLFDNVQTIAVQGYDENRRVIYWNKGSELFYGYTKEEALGKKINHLIIPESMQESFDEKIVNWLELGIEIPAAEVTLHHKNGSDVCVFSSHVLFINEFNKKQLFCIDVNLTEAKDAQAQVVYKEHMLQAAFETIPDLFFIMNENGMINYYHVNTDQSLYVPPNKYIGKQIFDILPKNVSDKYRENIYTAIREPGITSFEYELDMPHGKIYYEARISHLPEYEQIVAIVRDISEQHNSAEAIRRHAYYDALTSLPNRFLALDRLSQLLNEAKRNNEKIGILFIDLDDFKKINDTLGHEIGDKLLVQSSSRLTEGVREEDTVGRLGGDEFVILLRHLNESKNALNITENLLKAFRESFKIDGRELLVTLSVGIAIYPDNGNSTSELLRNADIAMYQAKDLGRNTYSFFTQEMNVSMIRRLEIEEQMQGALSRGEFEVYYQPQVDCNTNTYIGAEALLRWYNPTLGNISPVEFIPIAEQTGLIVPIGKFVVQQALSFLKKWQIQVNKEMLMAINLSPRQFRDANLLNFIKESLINANISPSSLELEITEGVLMIGQTYIDEALKGLNTMGIKLSMDDFGTGYSSLSYLRLYNFDVLKIDRSFINGITENKEDLNLVKATISMAHSLGLTVVAEGVETKEQIDLLHQLRCDFLQGYYFSKPVPGNCLLNILD